jgi:hypothetical protein
LPLERRSDISRKLVGYLRHFWCTPIVVDL